MIVYNIAFLYLKFSKVLNVKSLFIQTFRDAIKFDDIFHY